MVNRYTRKVFPLKFTKEKTLSEKDIVETSIKRVLKKNPLIRKTDISDIVVDSTPTLFYEVSISFWPNKGDQI